MMNLLFKLFSTVKYKCEECWENNYTKPLKTYYKSYLNTWLLYVCFLELNKGLVRNYQGKAPNFFSPSKGWVVIEKGGS
jgi:hypothetical protein